MRSHSRISYADRMDHSRFFHIYDSQVQSESSSPNTRQAEETRPSHHMDGFSFALKSHDFLPSRSVFKQQRHTSLRNPIYIFKPFLRSKNLRRCVVAALFVVKIFSTCLSQSGAVVYDKITFWATPTWVYSLSIQVNTQHNHPFTAKDPHICRLTGFCVQLAIHPPPSISLRTAG